MTAAVVTAGDFEFLQPMFNDRRGRLIDPTFEELSTELARFFCLVKGHKGPMAVMHPTIDALWHESLIQTERYQEFCQERFGFFVHHRTNTPETPVPPEAITNFYVAYAETYGEIPAIWFAGISHEEAKAIEVGDVPASLVARRWSGWPGLMEYQH